MIELPELDLISCTLTCLTSLLLGMEYGILIGIGCSILIILLKALRPSIQTEYRYHLPSKINYIYIETDQGLNFPSVDYVRDQISKKASMSMKKHNKGLEKKKNNNWNLCNLITEVIRKDCFLRNYLLFFNIIGKGNNMKMTRSNFMG